MKKILTTLNKERVEILSTISFLLGFSGALLFYIISFYFKEVFQTDNVGIFFLFSYLVLLVIILHLHKIIAFWGKAKIFYFTLIFRLFLSLILAFLEPSYLSVFFLVLFIISEGVVWILLDILLESFSTDNRSGRIRGLYLAVANTGFILGPFLSVKILNQFGFQGVFLAVFCVQFLVFAISLMNFRGLNHDYHRQETVVEMLKRVIKKKDILRIYYIAFVLEFFYALMVIYTPLYLLEKGLSWNEIGIIFSFMLTPFILLQYPAGVLADKKFGERELLIFAILVMGVSTLSIILISSINILIWIIVLFSTRVGASLIEILRDSYFYKKVDAQDVDIIDFFRTSKPIAYILATGIATLILLYSSMNMVFLITATVVLIALWPAFKLKDNIAEAELINKKRKVKPSLKK